MALRHKISRLAMAAALTAGVVTLSVSAPAVAAQKSAKIEFSKGFSQAAAELDKSLSTASSNPAVTAANAKAKAAKTPAEKAAAAAEVDSALGGAKAKLDASAAAATTPGDKLKLGEMTLNYGTLTADPAIQHKGLVGMLDSGLMEPAKVGQIQYHAGISAYQAADYASAATYLKMAKDSGYNDGQGLLDQVLADSYKRTGNSAAAMQMVQQEIASAKANGTTPSETSIRSALQAAYDAKQLGAATELAAMLGQYYPSPTSWNSSISVVRALTSLPGQDNLDLMRLMARTNSMTNKRDYIEYVENADPRRLPGETIKILDAGVAAGKLTPAEVAESKQMASSRLAADKASLPGLAKSGTAASSTAAASMGAGDALLSYGESAEAEAVYKAALTKSGVDKDRALVRMGIAQLDQGKTAEAKSTFAQVGGTRAPTAKLWTAYIDSKSAPATAAAQ